MPPGAEWAVRLAVRRADMNSFSLPGGYTDALYQSLIEVTDTLGSRAVVPVSANGLVSFSSGAGVATRSGRQASTQPDPRAGLWVGSVILSNVNETAISAVPTPTASEFQFRVILHVDSSGETKLLQKVVLAWTNGVSITNDQGFRETVTPGRFALITDENLLSRFSGSSVRDGTVSGRRFSTAAFGFRDPITVNRTGVFGDTNGTFSCNVPLGFDDAVNPFKHLIIPTTTIWTTGMRLSCGSARTCCARFHFNFQGSRWTTLAWPGGVIINWAEPIPKRLLDFTKTLSRRKAFSGYSELPRSMR